MAKFLQIEMPSDKSLWQVPAEIIAKDRAEYYAKSDPDTTYQEEYDYTLGDNSELIDWVSNNMDWSDIQPFAVRVERSPVVVNYARDWNDAKLEITER